jgi:DNA-binding protein H-NS
MARPTNLSKMNFEDLVDLRKQVEDRLRERRAEIEEQLGAIASFTGERPARGRGRRSKLKGKKVAPKYRGPSGETWAGRGARPRWLVAAIKGGKKKINEFLIDK